MVSVWALFFATSRISDTGSVVKHTVPALEGPPAFVRSLRPNYPYSIIAGGTYSRNELKFAESKDPVVQAHYADFDIGKAKLVRLADDRAQYVSYRIKDQVYWTKRKLRVPKGELLLTDGVRFVRARCGNRLSDDPVGHAASIHEPTESVLSLRPVSLDTVSQFAFAWPPELLRISANRRTAGRIHQP